MKRYVNRISLGLMAVAVVLALVQWIAGAQGNALSSAFEFIQSWVLITAAVILAGFLAIRQSKSFPEFVRTLFSFRANLPVPVTILSYLSTEWFLGFHEKYNVGAWHSGMALKGFWLGTIAQSHPSATNPFPNVHYSFWVNMLQWMVDHSVYSWFGYVVIGGELLIALTFITAILGFVYRPFVAVAAVGALIGLLFHFWFLMSGSAGVNALMPYLTGIAAVCLIGSLVAKPEAPTPTQTVTEPKIVMETIAVASEKVAKNGTNRTPVGTL